jgi:hypothetical protein
MNIDTTYKQFDHDKDLCEHVPGLYRLLDLYKDDGPGKIFLVLLIKNMFN